MEYFLPSWSLLFSLSALIQGLFAFDVTGSALPATFGGEAEITCSFSLGQGESLFYSVIRFPRQDTVDPLPIVRFTSTGTVVWGGTLEADFRSRINSTGLKQTGSTGTFSLLIKDTLCADRRDFQCEVSIFEETITKSDTVRLALQAHPDKPSLDYSPTYLKEDTEITVTCSGVLGLTTESKLKWRLYRKHSNSWSEITKNITDTSGFLPSPENCVYRGASQVKLRLTPLDNGNKVRCYATNPLLVGSPGDNVDYYDETEPLNVEFSVRTVSVSTTPNSNNRLSFDEGESRLTLTCFAEGNPSPTYTWLYGPSSASAPSDFQVLGPGKDYILENLHVDDTGVYQCFVQNTVDGILYNASTQVDINITPTTTPKPTTTPISTTGEDRGVTDTVTENGDDSTTVTIIAIVVCLTLVIIVMVIIIICCMKRRKKNKQSHIEEPPLKPRNNQDLNFKNKQEYYGKPDLVTTDSLKKPYNKNINNDDALDYADMQFDDKPRSRRPVQIIDPSNYSDVTMPRV